MKFAAFGLLILGIAVLQVVHFAPERVSGWVAIGYLALTLSTLAVAVAQ